VNRSAGVTGYCGETGELRLAAASIHRGEEPPITGLGGSGTVFVTGCNLRCGFCQNYQISQQGAGRGVSLDEFARLCLELERRGAENINLVTGSHGAPALAAGIQRSRSQGLKIPVLWNSSAYEGPEILSLLEDVIDGYLPDLKTLDRDLGNRLFKAPDYPEQAQRSIERMIQTRRLGFKSAAPGPGKVLASGVIVRHLVLPGYLEGTKEVLRWFAESGQGRALLSLMTQYTPMGRDVPSRFLNQREYEQVLVWLEEFGIEDGFYQILAPGSDWLPDFNRFNPFSSALSTPVWHWRDRDATVRGS
jgi:putative pyruvate formate lyase activating enzyme